MSNTTNLGITLPVNGTLDGTWGDVVNENMEIIDRAIDGSVTLTLTGSASDLTTTAGALTDGQYKLLILAPDGGSPPADNHLITIVPSTAQKIYFVRNTTAVNIRFQQGTGTTKATIPSGKGAIIYSDGSNDVFDLTSYFPFVSDVSGGVTGSFGVGTTSPTVQLDIRNSTTTVAQFTASISGTTMDVSGTASGTIAVGQYIFGANVAPNTYITALGTGSGGVGTYTVSISQTAASATVYSIPGSSNRVRITDTDTAVDANQPVGTIEFFGSDSSPGAGVAAYVTAVSESASPDTALIFGTRDAADAGIAATEAMRITSDGRVGIGTTTPTVPLEVSGAGVGLRVLSTAAGDAVTIESTDAGAAAGPDLALFRNSASPAASDVLGGLLFDAEDSAGNRTTYAKVFATISAATDGSESGFLTVQTMSGGTLGSRAFFDSTALQLADGYLLALVGNTGTASATGNGFIYDGVTSGVAGLVLDINSVSGTLAAGQYIYGPGIAPNTYIVAQTSGTAGGNGTYTVSVSQAVGTSGARVAVTAVSGNTNRIRIVDVDTDVVGNQPLGTLEFVVNDASNPTGGVGAYVTAISETSTPDVALVFGTRDNPASGRGAVERMRIGSDGNITVTGTINGVTMAPASQAQAEAGMDNATLMTPLRTQQAIEALGDSIVPLGSVTTSGGTSVVLSPVNLTGCRQVQAWLVNVDPSAGASSGTVSIAGLAVTDNADTSQTEWALLDLGTARGFRTSAGTVGSHTLTTSSTSITVTSTQTMGGGTITFYGVK